MVNYLLDNGLCNETERTYLEAVRKLHASTAGEGLGINCADGPFGPLTVIGGRIYMEDGRIFQTMDSRFPTCTNGEKMTEQIRVDLPLPEFGGPMHGANEAAPIDKLLEAVKIYIIALLRLEEIDF